MSKKIAAVVTDLFEDVELTSPQKALTDAGHEVVIVGEEKGKEITGKKGEKVKVDLGIDEVNAADYDAVLIPGGFSPDLLRGDEQGRFGEFVKHFVQNEKPSFAICHGPQLLIDTDLLEGKTVTSFLSVRKDLQNAGAKVVDESVVVDKGIVTSRTPDDLEDFNRESLALLQ
ncbi:MULTISPECIES: type 1 glutamine amidotransferase domain-containing protein [Mammaliicoccus]|uniref:type 1 glutamine amidotransferase domain-containing protein n=1 Tax=Mammaliicoccus TaxID=2803850 RepID=UPI000992DF6B|nr:MULTISPECIES: type 1 glutamine amidotransferase domain-containing protein [Mammaliicoccus]HCN61003.1 type 1 glutamine amidotransferase [Staphylococcus sp.]MBO3062104.1 type 1 glutamine amidotransferase [Mammaliicoccus fleurettii]MEB7724976.1 type 1 glutamine amidotransferase [Mammaliicoccus fleurettii]MEB7780682.1 type 1 glutamine amidotransferase [Mammaliicoccus fleurettii]MEB8068607.1 type 1 glutamine amidotransferase [Mammaliicoccus fleurettii]